MIEVATLGWRDREADDEVAAIVRAAEGQVALALSTQRDGDIEVFLATTDCRAMIDALIQALELAEGR